MAIRYDSQLKAQIRKTVKSFNAKIRRLEAKGVSAALLPNKVSTKEIRAGIDNRKDLRKRLNQLGEFTSAGIVEETETGLLGTNELFMYRQGEANRAIEALQREYDKINNIETRYPMMQGEYAANLRAKMDYLARDIRTLDIKQINIFNKNLFTPEQKSLKDEQFYNNFQRFCNKNPRGPILSSSAPTDYHIPVFTLLPKRLKFFRKSLPVRVSLENIICPMFQCIMISIENCRPMTSVRFCDRYQQRSGFCCMLKA